MREIMWKIRLLWADLRAWFFKKFLFRADRQYGLWVVVNDTMSVEDVRAMMMPSVSRWIPEAYIDHVAFLASVPEEINGDPMARNWIGWKYVPTQKG